MSYADLASENANHYPRQLQQAVLLTEHLLQYENISPSAITLLGDSAGAHLAMRLLLHIKHPNNLVSPLNFQGHFSGTVFISPWINLNSSAESMLANQGKDTLTVEALGYWARNFLGSKGPDYWNSLLTAPEVWIEDLPVDEILVLYGKNELLRDDASTLCERVKLSSKLSSSGSHALEDSDHVEPSSSNDDIRIPWRSPLAYDTQPFFEN